MKGGGVFLRIVPVRYNMYIGLNPGGVLDDIVFLFLFMPLYLE